NDNVMIALTAYVQETTDAAVQVAVSARTHYLRSLLFRYHDTFPRPEGVPEWPEMLPPMDEAAWRSRVGAPGVVLGDPDHALQACRDWESAGIDQLVLALGTAPHEDSLRTIALMGEHVIPKLDLDPEHRTDRLRRAAQ